MQTFLQEPIFDPLRQKLAATLRNVDTLTVGSMCSGWGVLEMVLHCLEHDWNETNAGKSDMKARDFGNIQGPNPLLVF